MTIFIYSSSQIAEWSYSCYFADGKVVITKRANYGEPKYEQSLISLMEELEVNGKWKKILEIPVPNYCYDNLGVTYVFTVL